jgi:hypothetical protein
MLSRTVLGILIILTCLALIAVLVFVTGWLADQTGEASPLSEIQLPGLLENKRMRV